MEGYIVSDDIGKLAMGQWEVILIDIGEESGLLVGHAIAKTGLFWLSGLVRGRLLTDWADLRRNPLLGPAFAFAGTWR